MSTFKIISVTDQKQCRGDFITRIGELARGGADMIILREKDLTQQQYKQLAIRAVAAGGCRVVLHSYPELCTALGVPRLQLPLPVLEERPDIRRKMNLIGVSVHSAAQALQAQNLGADYVVAGHVFATCCKPGAAGRGLEFLQEVCTAVTVPVYAIGGMTLDRLAGVQEAGAAGACFMSSLMQCEEPAAEIGRLRQAVL